MKRNYTDIYLLGLLFASNDMSFIKGKKTSKNKISTEEQSDQTKSVELSSGMNHF